MTENINDTQTSIARAEAFGETAYGEAEAYESLHGGTVAQAEAGETASAGSGHGAKPEEAVATAQEHSANSEEQGSAGVSGGSETAVEATGDISPEELAESYKIYEPYGLTYDTGSERLYYGASWSNILRM
jgi:hypothetical protein